MVPPGLLGEPFVGANFRARRIFRVNVFSIRMILLRCEGF